MQCRPHERGAGSPPYNLRQNANGSVRTMRQGKIKVLVVIFCRVSGTNLLCLLLVLRLACFFVAGTYYLGGERTD